MFVGNQKVIHYFEEQISKEKLSQAYLFCGPEKVGKKTWALELADKLAGFSGKINPDVVIIQPGVEERKGVLRTLDIKVEKIRELRREMGLHSSGGGKRIFIIDDAEKLTRASQNALLKILEEPSPGAIVILISKDENKLLSTIISRCQKIKFSLVKKEEIARLIPSDIPNEEAILFWSFSRPGIAVDLMERGEEMEFRRESFSEFKIIFEGTLADKFSLAEKLSKDRNRAISKMNLWLMLLRSSLLRLNANIKISPKRSFDLTRKIEKELIVLGDTNANLRLALENVFLE